MIFYFLQSTEGQCSYLAAVSIGYLHDQCQDLTILVSLWDKVLAWKKHVLQSDSDAMHVSLIYFT